MEVENGGSNSLNENFEAPAANVSDVDAKLAKIIAENGFVRPDRKLDEYPEGAGWREGKPDYRLADLVYLQGKTRNHAAGSLAQVVETLVKRWEMEMSHLGPKDWTTVDPASYSVSVNGNPEKDGIEASARGTYNWLFEDSISSALYDASQHTFESSHRLFRGAFTSGFPWEVLEVFSGPPRIAFTWRHWGTFNGSYEGRRGRGETIEMFGFLIATVNEAMKIEKVEVFYKPDGFIEALRGEADPTEQLAGLSLIGQSKCPITHAITNGKA